MSVVALAWPPMPMGEYVPHLTYVMFVIGTIVIVYTVTLMICYSNYDLEEARARGAAMAVGGVDPVVIDIGGDEDDEVAMQIRERSCSCSRTIVVMWALPVPEAGVCCPICMSMVDDDDGVGGPRWVKVDDEECIHVYHSVCLRRWFETGNVYCPLCMRPGDATA